MSIDHDRALGDFGSIFQAPLIGHFSGIDGFFFWLTSKNYCAEKDEKEKLFSWE